MLVWQQFTHFAATRQETGVRIGITRQSTGREDHLSVTLDTKTYKVIEAWIETPRIVGEPVPRQRMDCLLGQELYLGRGRDIAAAIRGWDADGYGAGDRDWLCGLALDALTVAFQAEAFLWQERGHRNTDEYVQHFLSLYGNGCALYSDPEFRVRDYAEYTQGQLRQDCLFSRHRSVHLFTGDQDIQAQAFLCDSFHEIGVTVGLEPGTGVVRAVDGGFVRAPEPGCRKAAARLADLVGNRLVPELRVQTAAIMGGSSGCAHLADLLGDVARTFADAHQAGRAGS